MEGKKKEMMIVYPLTYVTDSRVIDDDDDSAAFKSPMSVLLSRKTNVTSREVEVQSIGCPFCRRTINITVGMETLFARWQEEE